MPYVKSISIRTTVARSIAYILNPKKTDALLYTASLNCMTNAKDAYLAMKMVYENYSGKKYNEPVPTQGKGRVKAIHYIQSFDPKDNISPEEAHKIAKAFARKTFGDECQIVIATHVDTGVIHNHFILNSYGIDGKKFYDNLSTRKKIREYSDRVCLAFGVQPIEKSKGHSNGVAYNEWEHKKKGTSWKQKIKNAIDNLIGTVKNLDELLYELERQGFTAKRGKYISVKADGQQRFVRLKTLGDYYAEDILSERIEIALEENKKSDNRKNINDLNQIYYDRIYQVSELVNGSRKVQEKYNSKLQYSVQNDVTVYTLSAQLAVINRDRITSIGELEGRIKTLKSEHENTRQELSKLMSNHEQIETLLLHCEEYFELKSKSKLSSAEEVKFKIYEQTIQRVNVSSEGDIESIRNLKNTSDDKIIMLNGQFKLAESKFKAYSEIAETYYAISEGDYISRLISEKQKQQTAMKNHGR